ncbi:hypothetical protein DSM106972_016810 [Dulcicalothrix desertica PCC 7102]|uniref:Uncharacterized protein n=1 Tax=Dulcicalothrix desertica PCC 7102 TaxID=232991 RepID=A0A3S1BB86_9CYAN|nr:hypothetical protein [Dulcicalothrix desertica]RUT08513.1 hypothetical protein DSM106972_016810 [Dulcicalothrix desertica PCC 7102]TWH40371.1 hypothetical protein CAL7102_09692 [Dulcicalothrix desertica PCC 7102]
MGEVELRYFNLSLYKQAPSRNRVSKKNRDFITSYDKETRFLKYIKKLNRNHIGK